MSKDTQVSAFISRETRDELEQLVRSRGLKKAYVIEQALRHHLRALQELPDDAIIPPVLVLTRTSFQGVVKRLRKPGKPTAALRRLMKGKFVSDEGLH